MDTHSAPGSDTRLSAVGALVRRHDPDRFFAALFAPSNRRDALFTLYAFNHELARAREVVREPFAALIRLQWWREVVEGTRSREQLGSHLVAAALRDAIAAGALDPALLEPVVTAREAEAEGFETLADLERYALAGPGGLMVAAGHALLWPGAEALRPWGAAYGLTGLLGSVAAHARQGRCLLPLDLLREAGFSEGAAIARPDAEELAPVRARIMAIARSWADHRLVVPSSARAAALPVILARRRLRGASPAFDRLALTRAALAGI